MDLNLLVVSFLAGILTAAAPCVLPLLPVIVGGSVLSGAEDGGPAERRSIRHPLTIVISLAVSIIVFSLLLKATTALLGVPDAVWSIFAGTIVVLFGITLLWPAIWDRLVAATGIQAASNRMLNRSRDETGMKKDILLGAALGPVFNSCSPTYALIIAITFPASFGEGLVNLIAYAAGLALILLLISLFGRAVVERLGWLSDPDGVFRKVIGAIFILVGFGVIFGLDKDLQAWILENGWYDPIKNLEESLN
jgi:cytochrome c biogenesis protein CcdA